jgi:hypothetical protein
MHCTGMGKLAHPFRGKDAHLKELMFRASFTGLSQFIAAFLTELSARVNRAAAFTTETRFIR